MPMPHDSICCYFFLFWIQSAVNNLSNNMISEFSQSRQVHDIWRLMKLAWKCEEENATWGNDYLIWLQLTRYTSQHHKFISWVNTVTFKLFLFSLLKKSSKELLLWSWIVLLPPDFWPLARSNLNSRVALTQLQWETFCNVPCPLPAMEFQGETGEGCNQSMQDQASLGYPGDGPDPVDLWKSVLQNLLIHPKILIKQWTRPNCKEVNIKRTVLRLCLAKGLQPDPKAWILRTASERSIHTAEFPASLVFCSP